MSPLPLRPTVSEAIEWATTDFCRAGIGSSRVEAEWLVSDLLGIERVDLAFSRSRLLSPRHRRRLLAVAERRRRRVPLQQILGHTEFYSLSFRLSQHVLIPRPETEILVEQAIEAVARRTGNNRVRIADVGTGCGGIAMALAVNLTRSHIYATDTSPNPLATAKVNAQAHGVLERISFLEGDLLEPLPGPVDIIVANLPYIPTERIPLLEPEIREFEPVEALDGGADGLDLVRRLLRASPDYLNAGGTVLLEMDPEQMDTATACALEPFPQATIHRLTDLAGLERVLLVQIQ